MPTMGVPREDNPEFWAMFDGYNRLIGDWNKVNDAIHTRPVWNSFNRLSKRRRELEVLGRLLSQLQKDFLDHQGKAWNFVANPHFTFPKHGNEENDIDGNLSFHLYHSLLMAMINRFNNDMVLIVSNYNLAHGELDTKFNFQLAMASSIIAIAGLVVSLIALL